MQPPPEPSPNRYVARLDALQQKRAMTAIPYAVVKRFGEDRGRHFAALIAYYGFFSIFPLLLVFVNVLGFVLQNNKALQKDILQSAFANFPAIGPDLTKNLGTIKGNGLALAFGLLAALWAGLGAVYAAQDSMDTVWSVPRTKRVSWVGKRRRALVILGILGAGVLATTAVAGVGTQLDAIPGAARVFSVIGTAALNTAILVVAYRVLTSAATTTRNVLPGAVFAGIGFALVQALGSWYLTRVVAKASSTYGTFGIVIGLLTWIALQGRVFVYGAELNVVLVRRLWPRSVYSYAHTDADHRAEEDRVHRERT